MPDESDSMKEIFANESNPDHFEYESSPFFDKKNHRKNGDGYEFDNKFDDEFILIQMGTANASFTPLNICNCSHRIASLLREICYDRFAPLNRKRWEEMRGSETISGLLALLRPPTAEEVNSILEWPHPHVRDFKNISVLPSHTQPRSYQHPVLHRLSKTRR